MIYISSPAGQRLAKARASEAAALSHWGKYPAQENWEVWKKAEAETLDAAHALGDELIEQNFHLMEGD